MNNKRLFYYDYLLRQGIEKEELDETSIEELEELYNHYNEN